MQGAGNDFIVIDNRSGELAPDELTKLTPTLCDRKFGIGADGVLALEKASSEELDFSMKYKNADGSDAGMCGNGARCLALFAHQAGFPKKMSFNVHENIYRAEILDSNTVSIHFPVKVTPEEQNIDGHTLIKADTGTEHYVKFVSQKKLDDEEALVSVGSSLRYHKEIDPPGANINFAAPLDDRSIRLQTYERGVENLTLACGTGALATAVAAHFQAGKNTSQKNYEVNVKGGVLQASFQFDEASKTYQQLILTGPAHFVFKGIYAF